MQFLNIALLNPINYPRSIILPELSVRFQYMKHNKSNEIKTGPNKKIRKNAGIEEKEKGRTEPFLTGNNLKWSGT